jgi:hypothetical protein
LEQLLRAKVQSSLEHPPIEVGLVVGAVNCVNKGAQGRRQGVDRLEVPSQLTSQETVATLHLI